MDTFNTVSLAFAAGVGVIFMAAAFAFAFAKQNIEDLAREIGEADVMGKILPSQSIPLQFLTLLNKARNLREQCLSNIRAGKLHDAIQCAKLGRIAARDARAIVDSEIETMRRERDFR